MLENLLRDGRAAAPECAVTVLSHRPKETARRFDVDSLYYLNVPAICRRMKSARALVFGGGNLLQDATSRRSLVYYLALLRKGKQSGCRTLLYGAGLGPLSPRAGLGDRRGSRRCAGGYRGAHAPFRLGPAHGIDAAARAHTLVSCRNTGVRHRR